MAARARGYLRAPPPSPAPCTPPSSPARPPRPGRALTPGLGWQTRHRARQGRRAQCPSPGRGEGRGSLGRPGPPALLSPFQRPGGSGREEARCWRTGSLAPPRATRLGGRVVGARTPAPRAGGERAPGPRPLAWRRGPQRLLLSRHLQTDAAGGSCRHRLLCGAPAQPGVRRSRLGASVLSRSGTAPRGRPRHVPGPRCLLGFPTTPPPTKGVCRS